MRFLMALALLAFVTAPTMIPTDAAYAQSFSDEFDRVVELNRIRPLQNPRYEEADRIIGRRLVDRKSKVLGEVYDVIMNGRGSISSLYVSFNRLQLSQKVYLNYNTMKIRPATQSYRMAYDAKQIRSIYPDILAQTMTAGGEDGNQISLKNMLGKTLYNENGDPFARIDTVLFGYNGDRAEVIHIELRKKTMRGKTVAVPFYAVRFVPMNGSTRAIISSAYETAMLDYLK